MNTTQHLEPCHLAEFINKAKALVAITGAGVSTAAGIPDFRGPKGLYVTRRYDPEKVFDIDWFHRDPSFFYEFSSDFVGMMKSTSPTFSHRFLAALEKSGILSGVVTQNIDALHQEAGSENVVELHGSYRSARCFGCERRYEKLTYSWWEEAMRNSIRSPIALCQECGSALKPDIVFFGEAVLAMESARQMVEQCDLLLVLGSSLQVMPASFLPNFTNAITVVVNKGDVSLPPSPRRFFVDSDLDGYCRETAGFIGMAEK